MSEEQQQSTEVVRRGPGSISVGSRGVLLTSMDEMYRFAKVVVASGLAPKGIDTPEKAMIAIQTGAELGFSPMRSLSAIVVVNGKPGLYGEAALAKIHSENVCSIPPVVTTCGDGDERRATVRFQRRNMPETVEVSFSVADAKKAKLWNKSGPWTEYPDDMLEWRAVARMAKRYFSDVLMGLTIAEELRDYPIAPQRAPAPPTEPDPLLVTAAPAVAEASVVTTDESGPEPEDDERQAVNAIERLEGRIVTADSAAELKEVWSDAQPLISSLGVRQRKTLTTLYEQNLAGFTTA